VKVRCVNGGFRTHIINGARAPSILTSVIWLSVKSILWSFLVIGNRSHIVVKQPSSIPHDLKLRNLKWLEIPIKVASLAMLSGLIRFLSSMSSWSLVLTLVTDWVDITTMPSVIVIEVFVMFRVCRWQDGSSNAAKMRPAPLFSNLLKLKLRLVRL